MIEARSISSEVEVAVDAKTAFSAFTAEMNLWWVRGQINFFDAARGDRRAALVRRVVREARHCAAGTA